MKTILIVNDTAIFRDTVSLALRLEGYRADTASNGRETLSQFATQKPDLVLLGLGTNAADGLSIFAALRAGTSTQETPVILMIAEDGRQKIAQAVKLGVHDCVLKSNFSLADLVETIRRKLADDPPTAAPAGGPSPAPEMTAASGQRPPPPSQPHAPAAIANTMAIPRLLRRETCIARAAEAMEGKTLSGVVVEVISLAMSPRMEVSQLATLIARDPTLSAKVLRVANSAVYTSRGGPKTTVAEAVRNIGANTVRNLAAMTGIFEAMPETAPDGFNPIRCWQHSCAVARLAEHFASFLQPESTGIAYVAGLCHDLVEMIFHTQFAQEYAQIVEWETRTGRTRRDLEKVMLGIEQSELVVNILKQLGLPEAIHAPIEAFHRGASGQRSDASGQIARVLRLAELHANGLVLASSAHSFLSPLTIADCKSATGLEHPPAPDGQLLRNEVIGIAATLARFSVKDEAKLTLPLYSPSDRRVCLVRARSLSSLDPIETALASIARVTVTDEIPPTERLRGFQSLVMVAPTPDALRLSPVELESIRVQCKDLRVNLVWQIRSIDTVISVEGVNLLKWQTTLERLATAIGATEASPQQQKAA